MIHIAGKLLKAVFLSFTRLSPRISILHGLIPARACICLHSQTKIIGEVANGISRTMRASSQPDCKKWGYTDVVSEALLLFPNPSRWLKNPEGLFFPGMDSGDMVGATSVEKAMTFPRDRLPGWPMCSATTARAIILRCTVSNLRSLIWPGGR
jgi:hypothetical protein